MPFLGSTPAEQYKSLAKQTITGDGSTAYTLNRSVTNAYDMEVFINNIRQEPDVSYTASGNTITFTQAVTSSDSCYLIYQGQSVGSINPPANSVGGSQIQNTSVTNAHLAGAITDAKLHSSLDLSSKTLTMPAGHVIQVVHNMISGQQSFTSGSAAASSLSVSITPKYSNSKLLVLITLNGVHNPSTSSGINFHLYRDGSPASIGSLGPTSGRWFYAAAYNTGGASLISASLNVLDDANNTSSTTYTVYCSLYGSGTGYFNVNTNDQSSITVMEIAQ